MDERQALKSVCDDYVFYGQAILAGSHGKLRTELGKRGSRFAQIHRAFAKADGFARPTLSRDDYDGLKSGLEQIGTAETAVAINAIYGIWMMGGFAQLFAMRCGKDSVSPKAGATFARAVVVTFAPAKVDAFDAVEQLVTACARGDLAKVTAAREALGSVDFVLDCYNPRFPWQAPLTIAVANDRADVVDRLLADGADVNIQVRASNMTTATPLTTAARAGNLDMVKRLIGHHADLTCAESDGGALHIAVAHGHLPIAQHLIEECKHDVDPRNRYKRTPLMECGNTLARPSVPEAKRVELARYLIGRGADPTLENLDGYTAKRFADDNGFEKLASYLGSL